MRAPWLALLSCVAFLTCAACGSGAPPAAPAPRPARAAAAPEVRLVDVEERSQTGPVPVVTMKAPPPELAPRAAREHPISIRANDVGLSANDTRVWVRLDGGPPRDLGSLPRRLALKELGDPGPGRHLLAAYLVRGNGALVQPDSDIAPLAFAVFQVVPGAASDVAPRPCGACGDGTPALLVHEPRDGAYRGSIPVDFAVLGAGPAGLAAGGHVVRLTLGGPGLARPMTWDLRDARRRRIEGLTGQGFVAELALVGARGEPVREVPAHKVTVGIDEGGRRPGEIEGARRAERAASAQGPPEPPPDDEIRRKVKLFYESQGEFSGEYEMKTIARLRVVRTSPAGFDAHVGYSFRCVRRTGCCCGHAGEDQRVFRFAHGGFEGWHVEEMGRHQSASF